MNNPIDWSALILSILRSRGWTQVQLAARIGTKRTTAERLADQGRGAAVFGWCGAFEVGGQCSSPLKK